VGAHPGPQDFWSKGIGCFWGKQDRLYTGPRLVQFNGYSLDAAGVGRLVGIAAWEGKEIKPEMHIGVCGEHGGDPESIHFFESISLDYVSCSPFRVPVARLECGRASVLAGGSNSSDSR